MQGIDTRSANTEGLPRPPDNISPLRRQHVPRPPALTTTLDVAALHGYNPTPHSTTSLSSPFSQVHSAYHGTTPAGAPRGISPMSSRFSGYNAPYNPQEWAQQNSASPHTAGTGHIRPVQRPQAAGMLMIISLYKTIPDGDGPRPRSTYSLASPAIFAAAE